MKGEAALISASFCRSQSSAQAMQQNLRAATSTYSNSTT
jgi:hypothetical protein